jgi:hypothetical protein
MKQNLRLRQPVLRGGVFRLPSRAVIPQAAEIAFVTATTMPLLIALAKIACPTA